jgi:hypothetical protein
MKPTLIVIGTVFASLLPACASKDESTTSQSAATPAPEPATSAAPSTPIEPRIGGQLVTVGEHQVELKLFLDGYAEALVYDAQGRALSNPEAAKLVAHANANAKGGAQHDVALTWQPLLARFAADARAKAALEAKPVDVELALQGGKSARGTLASAVLLVGPELGGTLVVAADHGIEVVADVNGTVEALVHDRAGARVSGAADAKLAIELTGADGKLHAIALTWNEARARFTGKVDAGMKLAAGPAKIGLAGKAQVLLPKLALRAKAAHQGRVLVTGDYSLELVADGDALLAYAFDASGAAHAKGDLDLAVRLGSGAFVKLVWDAPSLSYRAKIEGAFDLRTQPIVASLKADGKVHVGASFHAKAKLDAKAEAKVDAPDVNAKAALASNAKAKAGAKANVQPPQVKVAAPKVTVNKSASSSSGGGKAKASAGFSIGVK